MSSQVSQRSVPPAMRLRKLRRHLHGSVHAGLCNNVNHRIFDPYSSVPSGGGSFTRTPFLNNVIPQDRLSASVLAYQNLFPEGDPDPVNPGFYVAFPA